MDDLYGFILVVLGGFATIAWWMGRGWIIHVDKVHSDLYEKNRKLHERLDLNTRDCQKMHMDIERKLGRIEGKLDDGV